MRASFSHGVCVVAATLLLPVLIGCAVEPEQMVVGKWAGDNSALGVGVKAAKLKADNPNLTSDQARDAARAMTSFAVVLKADKTCDMLAGGNKLHGKYTFDKAENLVEMEFTTAEIAPENAQANPEPFQPVKWIGMFDTDEEKLEMAVGNRDTYALLKKIRETQPLPGLIVLRKS